MPGSELQYVSDVKISNAFTPPNPNLLESLDSMQQMSLPLGAVSSAAKKKKKKNTAMLKRGDTHSPENLNAITHAAFSAYAPTTPKARPTEGNVFQNAITP